MKKHLLFLSLLAFIISFTAYSQNDPDACQDFRYYLSNNDGDGSDIYGIEIVAGEAQMTLLKEIDYPVHIGYNPTDELLYIVRSSNGSFMTPLVNWKLGQNRTAIFAD